MSPALADIHIIIAGAGLAGLTFAHAIDRLWPEGEVKPRVTIYERGQQHVAPEREGYSIGIRSDRDSGGMQALQKIGLLEQLLPISLTALSGSAGTMNLWDTSFTPIVTKDVSPTPPDGLPIANTRFYRPALLQHLRHHLPPTVKIHWSTQCVSSAPLKGDRVEVLLDDGTTADCDLLIAADGANSALRESMLPEDRLNFAGAVFIMGQSSFPGGVPDVIKSDWGLVLGGGGASLFAAPVDRQTAVWSVAYRSQEARAKTSSFQDTLEEKQALLDEARRRGHAFQAPFQQLIDHSALPSVRVFNARDKKPINNRKLGMPVVFIGDSSHAMSPFAGNGANLAIMDAVDLASELSRAANLNEAIAKFDAKSAPRAKKSVTTSHIVIRMAHSTGWTLFFWLLLIRLMFFLSRAK